MTKYSEEIKLSIIKRMIPPKNESIISISKETGIPLPNIICLEEECKRKGNIYYWRGN